MPVAYRPFLISDWLARELSEQTQPVTHVIVYSSFTEAADVADLYECKYIEISAILNHKVDDLLVGTLKQIRLNLEQPDLKRRRMSMKVGILQQLYDYWKLQQFANSNH